MASEVSICNQALGWLGSALIISLNDPSVEAQLCKANYAELRDVLLEEGAWSFAIKRAVPAANPVKPAYGYGNSFNLPSDAIRIIEVQNQEDVPNGESSMDWRLEDNKIMCDEELVYVKYVARVTDPKKFTSGFAQTLAARMAADMAVPLTQNRHLQADLWQVYQGKLEVALANDGIQGKRDRFRQLQYHRVR